MSGRLGELYLRGLPLEPSGRERQDARLGPWRMQRAAGRAWWPAASALLQREVRRHLVRDGVSIHGAGGTKPWV